jgi:hypothetical protein
MHADDLGEGMFLMVMQLRPEETMPKKKELVMDCQKPFLQLEDGLKNPCLLPKGKMCKSKGRPPLKVFFIHFKKRNFLFLLEMTWQKAPEKWTSCFLPLGALYWVVQINTYLLMPDPIPLNRRGLLWKFLINCWDKSQEPT